MKKHTITAALPYANGALHLGHLAGAYLPADIYARYLRSQGKDTVFICGSDEHGAAITMRAKKEGLSPKDIVDKYHNLNKDTFERLGISFDIYHRTSDPLHHETAQEFFKVLYEKGDEFIEKEEEQYYDEEYKEFLADRFILGTCPKCSNPNAYGDQCENCGSTLSPSELINPRSVLSGAKPVLRPTKHFYFKLDKYADTLKEWIEKGVLDGKPHHDAESWRNHVKGQCLSWIDGGLMPRAITRDLDWGVPVPVKGAEGKVLYVWFDAPIGYISATRQWAADNGKNWEDYWKGDDVNLYHFIGKDNIVFHCIIFPAMLYAHGGYALPVNVPANQFLNFEGQKFSKSRGWGIEQHEYLEAFKNFDNSEDALRYYMAKTFPEQKDSDFKWDEFVDAHDNELVANLGNFVNRVLTLTNKYFEGKVPEWQEGTSIVGLTAGSEIGVSEFHQTVWSDYVAGYCKEIERFELRSALKALMELSSLGNAILQNNAPWQLYKANPEDPKIAGSLRASLEICTALSVLMEPYLPFSAKRLNAMLNIKPVNLGQLTANLENKNFTLSTGHQLGEVKLLFSKINDPKDDTRLKIINEQKAKLEKIMEAEVPAGTPVKPEISYEDFEKIDLRIATIIAAEKVEKADKLLKLSLDLGFEKRTVVSGIALHFKPEDIIGQQVLLLANLAPRKLRGIDSQGMILMADDGNGGLSFVSPSAVPNGMIVK